jgi:hypothetical protein
MLGEEPLDDALVGSEDVARARPSDVDQQAAAGAGLDAVRAGAQRRRELG